MILRRLFVAVVLGSVIVVVAVAAGCSAKPASTSAATESHSDGDGIPDDVERQLGTDPKNPDTDFDGLSDYYELVIMPAKRGKVSEIPRESWGAQAALADEGTASTVPTSAAEQTATVDQTGTATGNDTAQKRAAKKSSGARETSAAVRGWKSIDPKRPYDSNRNGKNEAVDPYGPDVEVSLDATLVGRIHSAITAANGWDWSNAAPSAKAYNDAFVKLMMDETSTPAPLVGDGQRVVAPDLADPLTEEKATAAWTGRRYEAKIPVWKLDDADHGGDGDGIPTGYEAYGYTWDGSRFQPWGFLATGKSSYTPPSVGFEVVGNALTPLAQAKRDYTKQYFKTDPTQASSDADPYSDKLESTGANIPQDVKSPADRPSVAAFPSIVGYMKSATVTIVEDIQTKRGKKITKGSTSATVLTGDAVPKLAISSLVGGEGMAASTAGEAALDFIDSKAASVGYAALHKDPSLIGFMPLAKINANFNMTTDEWSETTAVKTDHAADIGFDCTLQNTGFASADKLTPTLDVLVGSDVVQSVAPNQVVNELAAQDAYTFHVNAVPLSLDQLKSVQSGAPVSVRLKQVDADLMVPQMVNNTVVYTDMGKWAPYESSMENWCARVTVDMGDGTYATYPVLAPNSRGSAPPVTLLDAMLWTLGQYDNGNYSRLNVPTFLPDVGQAKRVPSFGDWQFVFGEGYTPKEISSYKSLMDVQLKAGTHVLVKAPNSKGDRPSVPWATIAPAGGEVDITNKTKKAVSAQVDADMAVGSVWVAASSDSPSSTLVQLSDSDQDGVFTATLPESWRCISGRPQIVAQSAVRWGSGSEATGTSMVPAKTTAYTGLTGTLSGTVTSFPKHDLGISNQIVAFDFDGESARAISHGNWNSPPSGTDLSTWLYSEEKSHVVPGTGDVVKTIEYNGFFEAYSPVGGPKWMGNDSSWFDASQRRSLDDVKAAGSKAKWSNVQSGISELSWGDTFGSGDTVLLQTSAGRWVKFGITGYTYDTYFVSGAGTAKNAKTVSGQYTAYDPGQ